jgi:hypothetical protein
MITGMGFRYKNYIAYVMFYAGATMNMKNKNSMTFSANDILKWYDDFKEKGVNINIQQSNLSRAFKYMKDVRLLIPAGVVNREKRYYFNFQTEFLKFNQDQWHKGKFNMTNVSEDLAAYLFIYNCKKIYHMKGLTDGIVSFPGYYTFDDLADLICEYSMLYDPDWCIKTLENLKDKKWITKKDEKFLKNMGEENTIDFDKKINTDTLGQEVKLY